MRESENEAARVASVVAMEVGSRWPMWLDAIRFGSPTLITVVQHADQSLASLVRRVLGVIAEARRAEKEVNVVALACNDRTDRNAIVARAQIAKASLEAMSGQTKGHVVLTADQLVPQTARNMMLSLARSLADSAPTPSTSVGVSFGEYRSGLRPAASADAETADGVRASTGARAHARRRVVNSD